MVGGDKKTAVMHTNLPMDVVFGLEKKMNVQTTMPLNNVTNNIETLYSIEEKHLPLLVLSSDAKSFMAWAIRRRTDSHYSHLMWMHRKGFFASQNMYYKEIPIKDFKNIRLKLWRKTNWRPQDKARIIYRIEEELKKPKWKTRYDFLAILGQLVGMVKIQTPWTHICSDWAELLQYGDLNYNLQCPDPGDVNKWLETQTAYECFMRYIPD